MSVATAEPIAHRLVGQESTWTTVVWDDPVNLMDYVTMVFMRYFGYPRERATQLMIQVHNRGRATVAEGNKEEMEVAVHAMHGYGLQASVEKGGQG
ncbi:MULTISPECIES: ATP-dependent Clp protease adapter ClpS [Cutibacterium]|jgi:ATP-dependent clp protease adaptor protein clpS|uniref:ATP-dependent Clp protease adapter ClpS n=1 Tax=Cutibacterium TaxID=1912216 RepID=UPI0001EF3114|nr:ATP-dependent Clp protease adapter ClpS [Cutibacterium acnes]EGL42130.1 ATP-dependent Clp protease adaptor protein ClpS [Propionibacterium sp. 409-HC1]EGR90516.1 ATP-dependent Clp protease adaptor protein ClpS [Propionibacterium sp. CC003-HC2]OFP22080.1 ATP-dependent Clp protease adapter ClpS [Propionibacterium sp. HMSC062D02]ALT33516.1 Clp protease ClpS [Cutibacterium acnes]EFS50057.1 ATP-dependent Clp protease adaptor protein ClpS [Cutibacterium acnes HL025PA1]